MQVHLSTNLLHPAGEANAKCAGISDAGATGGFFSEMGQILNRHESNNGVPQDEMPSVTSANSGRRTSAKSESEATAHSRQSPGAGSRESHHLPDSGPDPVRAIDEAGSVTPETQSAVHVPGKSGSMAPAAGIESALGQENESESADAAVVSSASGNPQPALPPDQSANAGEILQPQKAGSTDQHAMNESAATGAFEDATTAGPCSGKPIPAANSPAVDSRRDPEDHLIENGGQQQRNVLARISAPMMHAGAETAAMKMQQVQAQNAPVNVDHLAAANSELSEAPESGDSVSPEGVTKNSPKAVRRTTESPDTSGASADQNQLVYKPVPGAVMRNQPEPGQMDPRPPQSSAAERQSPMQPVPASSYQLSGESAAATLALPAQPSTTHAAEAVFQLANQIRMQVRDGKGEICIRLNPDSLGRLEIRAENTGSGVWARISTESNTVKSYLDNNLQVLQQALQDQGLRIDRIHIIFQDASDSQSSSGFSAQFGHTGSGQNGREAQSSSGKASPSIPNTVDEAVPDPASWLALNPDNRFYTVA